MNIGKKPAGHHGAIKWLALALAALLAAGWGMELPAQQPDSDSARRVAMPLEGRAVSVAVAIDKGQVLEFPRPVRVVSVGNPEIADIVVMGSRQLYVLGKSTGTTNVVLWNRDENVEGSLNVTITHDLETLKSNLHELLPGESIEVRSAQQGIVLSGEVSSAERLETALRLANRYAGGEEGTVLNLMQVGGAQQVMLDVARPDLFLIRPHGEAVAAAARVALIVRHVVLDGRGDFARRDVGDLKADQAVDVLKEAFLIAADGRRSHGVGEGDLADDLVPGFDVDDGHAFRRAHRREVHPLAVGGDVGRGHRGERQSADPFERPHAALALADAEKDRRAEHLLGDEVDLAAKHEDRLAIAAPRGVAEGDRFRHSDALLRG